MAEHPTGTVKMACTGAATLDIVELRAFQGDLKTLSPANAKKLRRQILETGFSEPIAVWRQDGKYHVLNGHQRLTVLSSLREEGWNVPSVPVCWVEAESEAQARHKVLALTSQFGSITSDGLSAFLELAELTRADLEGFRFPELPEFVPHQEPEPPAEFKTVGEGIEVTYRCPKCSYEWSGKPL